jgi:lysine 2,3-aminomutase
MNGSADCAPCSPTATDDEPPGPLDLSSSILPTEPIYDAKGEAEPSLSFAAALGQTFSAVATVSVPVSIPTQDVYAANAPTDGHLSGGANSALAFLRQSSGAPTRAFRRRHFASATNRDWNNWRWQSRHRIRTLAQLESMLRLSEEEREALVQGGTMLPVGISPYYMSLLDADNPRQPLRRTVVPTLNEFVRTEGEADDPLGEDSHSPVPGLVHRYPDRVLLLPLDFCSTYCRYCTRSRVVGHGELMPQESRLKLAFDYLRRTPEIRDVLISGGDALALGEDRLEWILQQLRTIPNIEFIRIGTKMPAVLPQRITRELCRMLRRYHPIWMSVHFIHPEECTPEAAQACARLADAGIPLGSQTVLLKDVNDDVETIRVLMHKLLLMRVRPYYLYQCDPISGSSHFRTPVAKGLEIIEGLRGHTTGYAVPQYVIDAPGGGGKIPLQPNSVIGRDGDWLLLRNYEGREYRYYDPV